MKKVIFKFWIVNLLIGITLYFVYRIVIAETKSTDGNFIETVLQILDIILNLAYSFIYLITIVLFSFALFLNLIDKIRNNFYLSLLTFSGIPLFLLVFIILIFSDLYKYSISLNLVTISIIYLLFTTVEFFLFRKKN